MATIGSKLTHVLIKDFKGIESLEVDLKPITILVGPNNTGKSSLLEAIHLGLFARSGFESSSGITISPSFQVRDGGQKAQIEIETDDNLKTTLELQYSDISQGWPVPTSNLEALEKSLKEIYRWRPPSHKAGSSFVDDAGYPLDGYEEIQRELALEEQEFYQTLEETTGNALYFVEQTGKRRTEAIFIDRSRKFRRFSKHGVRVFHEEGRGPVPAVPHELVSDFNTASFTTHFNRLQRTQKFMGVLQRLRETIGYFDDLRYDSDGDYIVHCRDERGNPQFPLPISSMGDGFKMLLFINIIVNSLSRGIFLFEEIEQGLHPGYMDLVAGEILRHIAAGEKQIIFTTHGLDFVKLLLEHAKTHQLLPDISLLRHWRSFDKMGVEVLDSERMYNELEELTVDLQSY